MYNEEVMNLETIMMNAYPRPSENPANAASNACWCNQYDQYNDTLTTCTCMMQAAVEGVTTVPKSFDDYSDSILKHDKLLSDDRYFESLIVDMEAVHGQHVMR